MSASPLVSVVIPVFNAERWLPQALGSIQRQSHANLEIIVVDDGSTDGSRHILERADEADPRVKPIFFGLNQGVIAARNHGIEIAAGDYIACMDADDIAHPNRISCQLAHIRQQSLDLCGSWFIEFGMGLPRLIKASTDPLVIHTLLLFQSALCHPTVLAKAVVFKTLRYRNQYQYAADYDFFARASNLYRIGACPRGLLRYRRNPKQMTLAHGEAMQKVANRVRCDLLEARNIVFSNTELETHNRVRACTSIEAMEDLEAVEAWLIKLTNLEKNEVIKETIASQWARACVRAAPFGPRVWLRYRSSPLRRHFRGSAVESLDILVLTALRLRHDSRAFHWIRRLGLSG